jgi:hypothetical protein
MRFAVDVRRSRRVGRVNQAKAGAAIRVIPISHVFDPVFVLNLEVLAMRFGNIFGRHIAHVMAVHEDRHGGARSVLILGPAWSASPGDCPAGEAPPRTPSGRPSARGEFLDGFGGQRLAADAPVAARR